MWRLCLFVGAAWLIGLSTSFACEDPDNIRGIIYDAVPPGTPPSAIVLDVEFEHVAIERWQGGPIEARVRRVVQGDFNGDYVRVGLMNSSCLYPFTFGTEGLIIGAFREGQQVSVVEARSWPDGARQSLELRFGFEGTWFNPRSESIRERSERQ